MDRRNFLALGAALAVSPLALAAGVDHVDYSPGAYQAKLTSGEPLLLDFFAPW